MPKYFRQTCKIVEGLAKEVFDGDLSSGSLPVIIAILYNAFFAFITFIVE